MSDADPRPGRAAGGEQPPPERLWFLADREALLRRFVLRTLLEPPRFRRAARPRWLRR